MFIDSSENLPIYSNHQYFSVGIFFVSAQKTVVSWFSFRFMVGTILREAAIVFFFCNIFVGGQEFLEYYKPKPGLPEELNAWLADVQRYKKDFRLIRAIAKNPSEFGLDYEESERGDRKEDLLENVKDNEYLDYGPKNDIYPYVYKPNKARAYPENPPQKTRSSPRRRNSQSRLRRHSDTDTFPERRNDIAVNPKSTNGELKRSEDKYPDRYSNNLDKREIEIDVLNDGKLVKQFRDNNQDPKAIVLNIPSLDQEKNIILPNNRAELVEATLTEKPDNRLQLFDSPVKAFTPRSTIDLDNVPVNNKEYSSNLKNLFNANENLNTDSSIARDKMAKAALVYRVTLPEPNFTYQTPEETLVQEGQQSFNNNGFKDMSHFWSMSEKSQLQKGIDFAQDLWDRRLQSNPQTVPDSDGFELVKSVVVDSDTAKDTKRAQSEVNIFPNKRQSETLEGKVDMGGDNRKENCIAEKCRKDNFGSIDRANEPDDNENNKGEKVFEVTSKVVEHVAPFGSTLALFDMESDVDNGNGIRPDQYVDHQIPAVERGTNLIVPVPDIDRSPKDEVAPSDIMVDGNTDMGKSDLLAEGGMNDIPPADNKESIPEPVFPEQEIAPTDYPETQNQEPQKPFVEAGEKDDNMKPPHEINVEVSRDESFPVRETNIKNLNPGQFKYPLKAIRKLDEHIEKQIHVTGVETLTLSGPEEDQNPTNPDHPNIPEKCNREKYFTDENSAVGREGFENSVDEKHNNVQDSDKNGFVTKKFVDQDIANNEGNFETDRKTVEPRVHHHHKDLDMDFEENERDKFVPKPKMFTPNQYVVPSNMRRNKIQEYRGNNFPDAADHCSQGICTKNANNGKARTHQNQLDYGSRAGYYQAGSYEERDQKRRRKKQHPKKKHRPRARHHFDGYDETPPGEEGFGDYTAPQRRQLKSVEYDVDIEEPKEEYREEDEKGSTKRNEVHKNSVEGDYGDEEDSMTPKKKKGNSKLVKKTDNAYANPDTTTTEAEDDDEYYDEIADAKPNDDKAGPHSDKAKNEADGLGLHLKDEKLVSFGKRPHMKMQPPKKEAKPLQSIKHEAQINKASVSSTPESKSNQKLREPRNSPSQRLLDTSEFQQWPQFMRNDQIHEENLRLKSNKRKAHQKNNFPLASKDYFLKSDPKRSDLDKLLDKVTPVERSTNEIDEETVTINLFLDDRGKTNGADSATAVERALHLAENRVTASEDECETSRVKVSNVCEENENFNRTKVALTTMLSFQADGEIGNDTEYEKLDEILNGHLPLKIVKVMHINVGKYRHLKQRFLHVLKKMPAKNAFENLQDTGLEESRKLINAMAHIMGQLQLSTICHTIPSKLLRYLKSATKVRMDDTLLKTKQMEEVDMDDAMNQDNFIFQSNARVDDMEGKVRVLKDLLKKFNKLPDKCKTRAEPVREYIDNHLSMLTKMISGSDTLASRPKKTISEESDQAVSSTGRVNEKQLKEDLVEKQLESVGLGKKHNFAPKFNLDELIEHSRNSLDVGLSGNEVKESMRKTREMRGISEKYEKLLDAVKKKRSKRFSEGRVAETFGRLNIDDFNGESNRDIGDSFESPLVYSF
ncbi:hypothetical protein JTB14_037413 [Gonioctena quinquepunctata]|nr:hypothetical protein JTB14_037413 [Gonioctena quinquepunctata]